MLAASPVYAGLHDKDTGPREGDEAPDFCLKTLTGETVELNDYLRDRPVVLEFGCYTYPLFRKKHPDMENLREKYRKEAYFLTIYTLEANPVGDISPYADREWVTAKNKEDRVLYPQPVTESDRQALAHKARNALGISTIILVDDMDNSTWQAYGKKPNAAYLIGRDGKIKLKQAWFNPRSMEEALAKELNDR